MNNLMKHFFSFVLLVGFVSTSVYAGEPNVKSGMWKWSMTMQMAGMSFELPPTTYSSCLTKKDLIPQAPNTNEQCKMLKNRVTSDGVEWKMECRSEAGKSTSEGKMIYSKTRAKGEITVQTNGMTMVSKVSGHYIGNCN